MSRLNIWHTVPINKSSRPVFLDNEHSLFVKDGVGLYQGKLKIVGYQNGRVYLTNMRILYVDTGGKKAIGIYLSDTLRAELVERFLRSSPKVKVYLKGESNGQDSGISLSSNLSSVLLRDAVSAVWTCMICSFNNHVSTSFNVDLQDPPKCVSCGVAPSREALRKAIEEAVKKDASKEPPAKESKLNECPRCTFINHPSMRTCEMCGTELRPKASTIAKKLGLHERPDSPLYQNPLGLTLEEPEEYTNLKPYIKVSFRKGGETGFFEHAAASIDKLKWEQLEQRGGISDASTKLVQSPPKNEKRLKGGGIHSLQQLGEQQRRRNELVLSLLLDDLEQLMYKAQDLISVGSSFSSLIKKQGNFSMGKATTGLSSIPPIPANKTSSFYTEELARHICEYLLNTELTKTTSMITVQDTFASYNRYRIHTQGFGTELITTAEFTRCIGLFDTLDLPVKTKTYSRLGLVVITQKQLQLQKDLHWTILEFLIAQENLFSYEKYRLAYEGVEDDYLKEHYQVFHGCTITEVADHFGWAHAVCMEEMDRCIEELLVVYDQHISGTFYFVNKFDNELSLLLKSEEQLKKQAEDDCLTEQRQISSDLKTQYDEDVGQLLVNLKDNYTFGENPPQPPTPQKTPPADKNLLIDDLAGLSFS